MFGESLTTFQMSLKGDLVLFCPIVMPLESCKDIWMSSRSDCVNPIFTTSTLYNEKMENESVHSYVSRIRALVLKLRFIGCNREMTGYRLLDLETKRVVVRRNVEFHDESFSMIKSPFSKEVSLPLDFTDHIDSDPVTPIPLPIVPATPVPPPVILAPIPTIAPFPVQEEILDDLEINTP